MQVLNAIANNRYWNKHGVLIAWAVASACLLFALSYIAWTSYSQAQVRAANYAPQEIAPLARPAKKLYRVSDITSANLFGDPTPKPVVTNAPKTTLNLKLMGVLSASDQTLARAIITSGSKNTQLYSVGEQIQGAGASVKEIRPLEVLLNRNGATESLPLLKSTKSGKNSIISYSTPNAQTARAEAIAAVNTREKIDSSSVSREFSAANASSNQRRRGTNGKPRKVRKPNFSGLDRALKKMGEL